MAKIPDAQSFGVRPTPAPAGLPSIPNVDATLPARAIQQGFSALTGAAVQLAQAQQKIDNRDAFVARSKSTTSFNEGAVNELRRIETEADLSDGEAVASYRGFLRSAQEKALKSHAHSNESRAILEGQLEGIYGQYMGRATGLSLKAKRDAADDEMGRATNRIVESVYANPGPENILEQFEAAATLVQNAEAGYTANETRDWATAIESSIVEAAVTSCLDRGDVACAETAMTQTGVGDVIKPEKRAQIFSRIGTARAAKASRLAAKQKPIEVGGRLVDWEGNVIYDGTEEGVGGRFGSGVKAGTLDVFLNLGSEYGAGTTTPEEDQLVETAVTEYTQPYNDPNTGRSIRPELPAYMQKALDARGKGSLAEEAAANPGKTYGAPKMTFWEMALTGDLTGPVPALERLAGRTPGIGGGGGRATRLETEVTGAKRQLVRVLQNNPKFAEGERKAIDADLQIEPQIFDNPEAFNQRLLGIANNLERRLKFMSKLVASENTPRDQRYWAHAGIIAIEDFMEEMMPPRLYTPEQGAEFISSNPSGTLALIEEEGNWVMVPVP